MQVQLLHCTEGWLCNARLCLFQLPVQEGTLLQISLQPRHVALCICSPPVFSFLFLSQPALHHVLFLTFSTVLSFHSAGHTHSPQICTLGTLGRCMDQCPRIYAQNVPQVVSLASRVPSGKCHCLTHISQISSITQATLLPPE